MKKLLPCLLLLLSISTFAAKPGVDYKIIAAPVETADSSKIEVKELFWYFCQHCYALEPSLKAWLNKVNTVDSDVNFIAQPAVFSERWALGALYFYVLEKLQLLDTLHEALFTAIHAHKINVMTTDRFIDWLLDIAPQANLNKEQIEKVMQSFSMKTKLNRAAKLSREYGATGVPSFIVNGKYLTSPAMVGGAAKMFAVIDELIAEERALLNIQTP